MGKKTAKPKPSPLPAASVSESSDSLSVVGSNTTSPKKKVQRPIKMREVTILTVVVALVLYRALSIQMVATLFYNVVSYILRFDSDVIRKINTDGEVEDGIFTHRFIDIKRTKSGLPVNATYHVVECGSPDAEPIVFFHGLGETWLVWKEIMLPFCSSHRPIAVDNEGQGQSSWPSILHDLQGRDSRKFMGDMQLALLFKLKVDRFNLVVSDYGFWSSMHLLTVQNKLKMNRVLRYGKFQSTVGVDDVNRIPQAIMFKLAPQLIAFLFNLNPYALPRVLMGKTKLRLPALVANNRTGPAGIPDSVFERVILPGIAPGMYTSWAYFYYYGKDMVGQMTDQLAAFENAPYPVYMLQGDRDLGQPKALFDGTVSMKFTEAPVRGVKEWLIRSNTTHKIVTTYAQNGIKIGPPAHEFFPNSRKVRFRFLKDIGHFIHLEAPLEVIKTLKELLAIVVD